MARGGTDNTAFDFRPGLWLFPARGPARCSGVTKDFLVQEQGQLSLKVAGPLFSHEEHALNLCLMFTSELAMRYGECRHLYTDAELRAVWAAGGDAT